MAQILANFKPRVNPTGADYGFERDLQFEQELLNLNEYLKDEDFLDESDFEMPPLLGNTNSSSTAGSDFQWNKESFAQETALGLTSCKAIVDRHCEKIDLNKFDPTILNGTCAPTFTTTTGGM